MIRLEFEDWGQDCLWWDLFPYSGEVVNAGPFQRSFWQGLWVHDYHSIKKGDRVHFTRKHPNHLKEDDDISTWKYKVQEVRRISYYHTAGNIQDIRCSIGKNPDYDSLIVSLEEEQGGQKRATVMKMLESAIHKHQKGGAS